MILKKAVFWRERRYIKTCLSMIMYCCTIMNWKFQNASLFPYIRATHFACKSTVVYFGRRLQNMLWKLLWHARRTKKGLTLGRGHKHRLALDRKDCISNPIIQSWCWAHPITCGRVWAGDHTLWLAIHLLTQLNGGFWLAEQGFGLAPGIKLWRAGISWHHLSTPPPPPC